MTFQRSERPRLRKIKLYLSLATTSCRRRNSLATDRYVNIIFSDDRNGGETRNLIGRNNCPDDYSGDFAKIRGMKVEDDHTLSSPITFECKKELVIVRERQLLFYVIYDSKYST